MPARHASVCWARPLAGALVLALVLPALLLPATPVAATTQTATAAITSACPAQTSLFTIPKVTDSVRQLQVQIVGKTDDPNENGENEPIFLKGPGIDIALTSWNIAASYTFSNPAFGAITGCVKDLDSDETVTVTFTFNSVSNTSGLLGATPSNDAKTKHAHAANTFLEIFIVLALMGIRDGISADSADTLIFAAGMFGDLALEEYILAKDPPDPNFATVAQPVIPSFPKILASAGVPQALADATNALAANTAQQVGLGNTLVTAINRSQGAALAGDTAAQTRQTQAAQQFATQLATLTAAMPGLLATYQSALSAANLTGTFTKADIATLESSLAANGMPAKIAAKLTQLGISPADQAQLAGAASVQDQAEAAALGGGKFPQMLTDPAVTGAIKDAGQSLTGFAAAPNGGTISASPTSVPFGQTTTKIDWDTLGSGAGQIFVSVNGGAETLLAGGATGSLPVSFINSGSYVFTLYAGTAHSYALASVTVTKLNPKGATGPAALATPASLSFATAVTTSAQLVRSSTIAFDTGDGSVGQVMLAVNGGTPVLFTASQFGSVTAPWVFSGKYTFTLMKGGLVADTATVQTTAQISTPNDTTAGGFSLGVATTVGKPVALTFDTGTGQAAALCTNFGGLVSFSQNGAGNATSVDTAGVVVYSLHVSTCAGALATSGTVTVTAT